MTDKVQLYVGDALGRYGFPDGHPFGPDRQDAFWKEAEKQGLPGRVELREPRVATAAEIERFHEPEHVERVRVLSHEGHGSIDYGDTPAYPGGNGGFPFGYDRQERAATHPRRPHL